MAAFKIDMTLKANYPESLRIKSMVSEGND
jgi:hypothetical protein